MIFIANTIYLFHEKSIFIFLADLVVEVLRLFILVTSEVMRTSKEDLQRRSPNMRYKELSKYYLG